MLRPPGPLTMGADDVDIPGIRQSVWMDSRYRHLYNNSLADVVSLAVQIIEVLHVMKN